jgi:hypothetical protein
MPDIFGYRRNPKPRGVFSTEDSLLQFGTRTASQADATGMLVQNWSVTYAQNVQEVFELGSNTLYWVKGRPQGGGRIARVVGVKDADLPGSSGLFPPEAFDICLGGALFELKVRGGNCDAVLDQQNPNNLESTGKQLNISMEGCVITSIGFSADVNDTRVLESVEWRFTSLAVDNKASQGAAAVGRAAAAAALGGLGGVGL